MSEIAKLFSSLLLLTAGFVAASFFGPPELVDHIASRLTGSIEYDPQALQPLPPGAAQQAEPAWRTPPNPAAAPTPAGPIAMVPGRVEPAAWPSSGDVPATTVVHAGGASTGGGDWFTDATDWMNNQAAPAVQPTADRAPLSPVRRAGDPAADPAPTPEAFPALGAPRSATGAYTAARPIAAPAWNVPAAEPARAVSPTLDDNPWGTGATRIAPGPAPPATGGWPTADQAPAPDPFATFDAPREAPQAGFTGDYFDSEPMPVGRDTTHSGYHEHVVTDGDTLPLIAERYLGDAARARELFELNRDRLDHPDLLPIGMVLRAPVEARRSGAAQAAAPPLAFPSLGTPATGQPGVAPFATVSAPDTPPAPGPLATAPRESLRPIGAPMEVRAGTPSGDLFETGVAPIYAKDLTW